MKNTSRSSGILMHITSLPGRYPLGTMGEEAYDFARMLASAGQKIWQVLPLNRPAGGISPYMPLSAFAGNPLLISPGQLAAEGLISRGEIKRPPRCAQGRAWFDMAEIFLQPRLIKSFQCFRNDAMPQQRNSFVDFCCHNSYWLEDYALFMAIRNHYKRRPWARWSDDLKKRRPDALKNFYHSNREEIEFEKFVQFVFFNQWEKLKDHANKLGVKIIGDCPLYMGYDSACVWSHPELFQLNTDLEPELVSGVPPDIFSKTGQLWGHPLYHWENHKMSGYTWWTERLKLMMRTADLIRIDHFIGFFRYWSVKYGRKNAITGRWARGPEAVFFETVTTMLPGLQLIAEDLGRTPLGMQAVLDKFGIPGMRVLQFAFDGNPGNPFLPANYPENCIAYTGTHDNQTTAGWYRRMKPQQKKILAPFLSNDSSPCRSLISMAMESKASMVVFPFQDILELGNTARMNKPGSATGDWRWRATPEQWEQFPPAWLREVTLESAR